MLRDISNYSINVLHVMFCILWGNGTKIIMLNLIIIIRVIKTGILPYHLIRFYFIPNNEPPKAVQQKNPVILTNKIIRSIPHKSRGKPISTHCKPVSFDTQVAPLQIYSTS